MKLAPWYRRIFTDEFKNLIGWHIEHIYKKKVEKEVRDILSTTNLVPHSPHNMKEIMKNTENHFVNHELHSEICISSGVAATAMMNGYSGIVNISPFACLIGRVIEGIYTPWARQRKYPTISVEIDGNLLPPNVLSNLEIFMLNVKRFRGKDDPHSMVERREEARASVDRKIIR